MLCSYKIVSRDDSCWLLYGSCTTMLSCKPQELLLLPSFMLWPAPHSSALKNPELLASTTR
jgi:hypothetical protein